MDVPKDAEYSITEYRMEPQLFGLQENRILEHLQSKLNIPLDKAQEYLELYGKQMV